MSSGLDPESLAFQTEVEGLVRRWAGGDEREYWRRWKQLGSWSLTRTQGDVVKKAALKKRLLEETGSQCHDCGEQFSAAGLQMHMHRLDRSLAHQKTLNFGYVRENVVLLCAGCHEARESDRR